MNKKVIAGILICVLVGGVALWTTSGVNAQDTPQEEVQKEIVVDTGTAFRGDIVVTSEYIGRVEPGQQVMVIPKLQGEVTGVYFAVGDTVEAGDILFEIDAEDLRLQVAATQAQISSGQARAQQALDEAQQGLETYQRNVESGSLASVVQVESQVVAAQNGVEQARVALSTARRSLREHRDLDEDDYNNSSTAIMSGVDYDQMTTKLRDAVTQCELALEGAEAGLESAQAALSATNVAVSDQETTILNGIKQAELANNFSDSYLNLQRLQNSLAYATVTSPISGVVEQCNVEQFGMATSASPAFIISNKDLMTISFQIPETSLGTVMPGDEVTVEKNGQTARGTISEVGTMAQQGGLFTVKAHLENPPFDLFSGSTVKLYADNQKAIGSLVVPLSYVYYDNGKPYVYVAREGTAHKVQVETGIYDSENVEILGGITLQDEIISTWNASLADGAKITLAKDVAQPTGEEVEAQ